MKFLGNFKDWISPETLTVILETPGEQRPGNEINPKSQQQYDEFQSSFDMKGATWSFYYDEHTGIRHLELPFPIKGSYKWWFVKINPGCVFPLHVDTFEDDSDTVRRLWIPCQDYIPGHVFIYKDNMIKDYKAFDVFEFDDPTALHGSSNISNIPKISLQIVNYINQ